MNKTLTLSQLEKDLILLQQQQSKLETLARTLTDPTKREEARQSALDNAREIEKVTHRIEELKQSGIA